MIVRIPANVRSERIRDEAERDVGDAVMAPAALDRLLHRCAVVNIRGESYRLKEKRQAGLLVALGDKRDKSSHG
jgi:hypothetical protein